MELTREYSFIVWNHYLVLAWFAWSNHLKALWDLSYIIWMVLGQEERLILFSLNRTEELIVFRDRRVKNYLLYSSFWWALFYFPAKVLRDGLMSKTNSHNFEFGVFLVCSYQHMHYVGYFGVIVIYRIITARKNKHVERIKILLTRIFFF